MIAVHSDSEALAALFVELDEDDAELYGALPMRTISIRLTGDHVAWIDSYAEHANLSRNEFLRQVIESGLGGLRERLPDSVFEEIALAAKERIEAAA